MHIFSMSVNLFSLLSHIHPLHKLAAFHKYMYADDTQASRYHYHMNIHQTHTHRHTHTLPIWWIWAGRQGIKPNRRINLNDLWKILVMTFMNTLWNIENVVINFDVRKWGRNIKQTALNFEQGLHVKSTELTESEGGKDWGTGDMYFVIQQLFWTWQQ